MIIANRGRRIGRVLGEVLMPPLWQNDLILLRSSTTDLAVGGRHTHGRAAGRGGHGANVFVDGRGRRRSI